MFSDIKCILRINLNSFTKHIIFLIDVEYIYGFVWWGGLQAKSMTSQRYRAVTRWRICVTMVTLWQQQDGGYMLLWKRYVNNKMAAMRFLHLQQYSHRLNLLYVFFILSVAGGLIPLLCQTPLSHAASIILQSLCWHSRRKCCVIMQLITSNAGNAVLRIAPFIGIKLSVFNTATLSNIIDNVHMFRCC